MNGEKPGRQAAKGEATEVSGEKWGAAVPRTLLPFLNGDHGLGLPLATPTSSIPSGTLGSSKRL